MASSEPNMNGIERPTATPESSRSPADLKLELELRKLELEVSHLAAPWWRRPSFVLAALPTALAILTLVYGFSNGYFQAVATKLENQRFQLSQDVKGFEVEREKLQDEIKFYREQQATLMKSREASGTNMQLMAAQMVSGHKRAQQLEEELQKHGIPIPAK